MVHLAQGSGDDETVGVVRQPEVLGIQAKKRTVTKRVTPGIGAGGLLEKMKYPAYTYEGVDPGFAEHDLDQYDAVAAVFFLDTAPNLIRYLEVIRHCLKPGGVLINVGPLLWHWENLVPGNQGYDGDANEGDHGDALGIA